MKSFWESSPLAPHLTAWLVVCWYSFVTGLSLSAILDQAGWAWWLPIFSATLLVGGLFGWLLCRASEDQRAGPDDEPPSGLAM